MPILTTGHASASNCPDASDVLNLHETGSGRRSRNEQRFPTDPGVEPDLAVCETYVVARHSIACCAHV
jgi:hypothetical protein